MFLPRTYPFPPGPMQPTPEPPAIVSPLRELDLINATSKHWQKNFMEEMKRGIQCALIPLPSNEWLTDITRYYVSRRNGAFGEWLRDDIAGTLAGSYSYPVYRRRV